VASRTQLKVISASEIAQVLGYQKQQALLGCNTDACISELAGALGVDYLLTSQLGRIGSRYRVDIRVADAHRATLVASAGDFVPGGPEAVADATVRMTRAVLAQAQLEQAPAPSSPAPEAAVSTAAPPDTSTPSHTPAFVAWGAAGALAIAAAAMTAVTVTTFHNASSSNDASYVADANSLTWKGPLADGLWAAALVAGGTGAYLYFTAAPAHDGAGGEVAVGGRF
jgi:TolB-like protein